MSVHLSNAALNQQAEAAVTTHLPVLAGVWLGDGGIYIISETGLNNEYMQPIEYDKAGVLRFRSNPIVGYLLDAGGIDMNQLARCPFEDSDREQFAQLIGYSLGGYSELSYVGDTSCDEAARRGEVLIKPSAVVTLTDVPEDLLAETLTHLPGNLQRHWKALRGAV